MKANFLLDIYERLIHKCFKKSIFWGGWVAQSSERPTSAQVMISQFVSSSPTSGSMLTAQGLEPASDSVSPTLSAPPLHTLCLSLPLCPSPTALSVCLSK